MKTLTLKFIFITTILSLSCLLIRAQKPLNTAEKAYVAEAKQDLEKALTSETISEADRTKMVARSATTLKEYGQPVAFPMGDIPLKKNIEKEFRTTMGRVIYANDFRNLLNNSLMTDQLSLINKLQIEVTEEQIKFLIPGKAPFDLSREVVESVFNWNISEGTTGGKRGDANALVQKFKDLAAKKLLQEDMNEMYSEQRDLLLDLYRELLFVDTLQSKLRKIYVNAANSAFTFKEYLKPGEQSSIIKTPAAPGEYFFKASLPSGWKIDVNKSGSWTTTGKRKIAEKSGQCGEIFLDSKVTANLSYASSTMTNAEIDKKLRSWLGESGLYPEEESIGAITINGFKGRLLTTTLKYRNGFGSPMAGYRAGLSHIGGFAILMADDGTRILKISYYSLVGSCWDNSNEKTSKSAALSGKKEAEQVVKSLTISGIKNSEQASQAGSNPALNIAFTPSTPYTNPKHLYDDKLREVLLQALTQPPATKQEIKYWTEREKTIKITPAIPPTKNEPTQTNETSVDMIVGDYDVNQNGFTGKMEIRKVGNLLEARIYFNVNRNWEPLENVQFNASTKKITFLRPKAKQYHEGVLNGSTLSGTFTGGYKWSAIKTTTPQVNNQPITTNGTSPDMIVGDYDVNQNGFTGKMEIRKVGNSLEARIYFNVNRNWEPLENVQFNSSSKKITFMRPKAKQYHEGVLNGSTLSGTFTGGYKWSAIKTSAAFR